MNGIGRAQTTLHHETFFAVREALWAKPMWWFGAAFFFLQHINGRTSFQHYKFVLWLLAIPCFQASNFCFQRLYLLQHRHLVSLGRYCASKGGTDLSLHFDDLPVHGVSVAQLESHLRNIKRRLERARSASDGSHVNHVSSND